MLTNIGKNIESYLSLRQTPAFKVRPSIVASCPLSAFPVHYWRQEKRTKTFNYNLGFSKFRMRKENKSTNRSGFQSGRRTTEINYLRKTKHGRKRKLIMRRVVPGLSLAMSSLTAVLSQSWRVFNWPSWNSSRQSESIQSSIPPELLTSSLWNVFSKRLSTTLHRDEGWRERENSVPCCNCTLVAGISFRYWLNNI